MDAYKNLLIVSAKLIRRARTDKVSLEELSAQMHLSQRLMNKSLKMLKEAGHIKLEKSNGKTFISPTITGYEKAKEWEKEIAPWYKRNSAALLKIVGGSLIAALLTLIWNWLGLAPATTLIEPLTTSNPIKLYEPDPLGSMWVLFDGAPDPDTVLPRIADSASYDLFEEYGLPPSKIPISFDGSFSREFKIENTSSNYSVIVDSVLVRVVSNPIKDPADLYFFAPGLGGAEIAYYEIDTSKQLPIEEKGNTKTYKATLTIDGKSYDYLTLASGENQKIAISIKLDSQNVFELTPIINYTYRGEKHSVPTSTQTLAVPARYRIWFSQDDRMYTNKIIIDNRSGMLEMPKENQPDTSSCVPDRKWIAFETRMLTYGYLEQLFLMSLPDQKIYLIGKEPVHWSTDYYYKWLDTTDLLIGEPIYEEKSSRTMYEMKDVSVADTFPTIESKGQVVTTAELGKDKYGVCFKTKAGCIRADKYYDTNNDQRVDYQDKTMLILSNGNLKTPLWFSGESQLDPAISPDDNWIAFVQTKETESSIFLLRENASLVELLTTKPGIYKSPAWSPDGKYLAVLLGAKDEPSDLDFFLIELATKKETRLTSLPIGTLISGWSEDGKYIITVGDKLAVTSAATACTQVLLELQDEFISNAELIP